MTEAPNPTTLVPGQQDTARPITIAVNAIGGQGGGVLAEWSVHLADTNGYYAQYTSVPGVAQRTGATIYYLEIYPESAVPADGRPPILALMPAAGDVDVVIASELMEAGRAMIRNLVTPDRTTLIASSHRVYGILEKAAMGDGTADPGVIREAARRQAKAFIDFDMDALAADAGTVISSVLFGALAGAGALPFPREAFEKIIVDGKRAVKTNLAGFASGFDGAKQALEGRSDAPVKVVDPDETILREKATTEAGRAIIERIIAEFPKQAHAFLYEGAKKCADALDHTYVHEYLDKAAGVAALDTEDSKELTAETARYLALWMAYEDTIRVADLKTRASRFERVREEVRALPGQLVYTTEFMHPRYVEVCEAMPAFLGGFLMKQKWLEKLTSPLFSKGRFVKSAKLRGFLLLTAVATMRPIKRITLRHKLEHQRMNAWLERVKTAAGRDYAFAVQIVKAQQLIKGYSDTHQRGLKNFTAIMEAVETHRSMTAGQLEGLTRAALQDETGKKLEAALDALTAHPEAADLAAWAKEAEAV
ncbi:MAG: indolepyruvate oxidoreductase subunit beta family protein [Sphingomonadales bacterium]